MKVEKIIEAGIKKFNKYRKPEAIAELLEFRENEFSVKMSGTFCLTCGFYDYFEDLRLFLEECGLKTEIKEIREIENGAIIKFKIVKIVR